MFRMTLTCAHGHKPTRMEVVSDQDAARCPVCGNTNNGLVVYNKWHGLINSLKGSP